MSAKRAEQVRKNFEKLGSATLKSLGVKNAAVAVFFLPSKEMSRLKYKYLGKRKKFVDVLAFPEPAGFPHPGTRKKFLGEVYLNELLLKDEKGRLIHLFFHGVLHILGFSHDRKSDTIEMEKLEDELLRKFFQKV